MSPSQSQTRTDTPFEAPFAATPEVVPVENPLTAAESFPRFAAMLIDGAAAAFVGLIPLIGGLIGAAYLVCRDCLPIDALQGRSLGKKLMGLRPVRIDGAPMDMATSVRRNWMFGFAALVQVLLFIPILGWLLMVPVALLSTALGLFEGYKVLTDAEGRRMGDRWADTQVIAEA